MAKDLSKYGDNVDFNALWRGEVRRTSDSTWDNRHHSLPKDAKISGECGVDLRYMNNEFFDQRKFAWDKQTDHRNQFGREYGWNRNRSHSSRYSRNTEPEWMTCGPTSQNDVIELNGFKDALDKDVEKFKGTAKDKTTDDGKTGLGTPNNSTPTKPDTANARKDSRGSQKNDENFNFEDFLKFDLTTNANGVRGVDKNESRFTRWFRKENSPSKHSKTLPEELADSGFGANQFFELMQKTKGKKSPSNLVSMSSNFLSVEDLEADLCVTNRNGGRQSKHNQEAASFRNFMNQLGNPKGMPAQSPFNLQEILNKNAHDLFQYQLAQEQILRRHDAQVILHRLSCNDISLLHVLQQLGNPTITPYERDTLMAIVNYCNGHNRIQQTLKQKQQVNMANQLRNLQINTNNGGANPFIQRPPTPQELQLHTQSIMQNALLKKQLEQYHLVQQMQLNGGDSVFSNLLQQAAMRGLNGFAGNENHAHKLQQQFGNQGLPPNVYKKPYGRKVHFISIKYINLLCSISHNLNYFLLIINFAQTSGFTHQQHQQQQQQQNIYQSSKPAFGRKIMPQNGTNTFTLSPVVQKKWNNAHHSANINVADVNSTTVDLTSLVESETTGTGFEQTKNISNEVDK